MAHLAAVMSFYFVILTTLLAVQSGNASADQGIVLRPNMRASGNDSRACPCSAASLCEPITTTAKYEVFAFMVDATNYQKYDWRRISTVILFSGSKKDEVMCYAHSKGVRVSYGADFPVSKLTDPSARSDWVQQQVAYARDHFLDGINLDFESSIAEGDKAKREGLNSLVSELTKAFKGNFKNPQVTFDVPYTPHSDRHFDYVYIANTMDFVLVMSYDESGSCYPKANSGFGRTTQGVKDFMALGISPEKLVLGLPWYGYDYPCSNISKENVCHVSPKCGGKQVVYGEIMNTLYKTSTSGRLWDTASQSPFFNYKTSTGGLMQVWYDDPESLGLKYKWAATNGLRGVGMWTADSIDYSDTPEGQKQRTQMWGALPIVNSLKKMEWKEYEYLNNLV